MSTTWIVNGWRQQARSLRAIDKALTIARERGMQSYIVSRVGRTYWLLCSREAGGSYDLAATLRRRYAKVEQGIYLGCWRQQAVVVVWRGDSLQHCLACALDADGIAHLKLVLERVTRKSRRRSALMIAESVPDELRDYCHEHLAQWQLQTSTCEINELRSERALRLRAMSVPPPWQQRQRFLNVSLLILVVTASAGWYWWPEPQVKTAAPATVQQALPDPNGLSPEVLRELPALFAGMQHLAGWQWRSAQVQGQQLRVDFLASHGRAEELAIQLNPAWTLQLQRDKATALRAWPRVPYKRQLEGFGITALDVATWQQQLQRFFPELEIRQGRTLEDTYYRQQTFTLNLAETNFNELARMASLLSHPHLRLTKLTLQARQPLRTELEVHLYEPRPIATEGASS